MDIEIINEKENPLLERKEIAIKVIHPSGSPKFGEIRSKMAAIKDLDNDKFVLQSVKALYGASESTAEVRVYLSNDRMMNVEQMFVLKKNGHIVEKSGDDEDGE